jgi:hypothetical protein
MPPATVLRPPRHAILIPHPQLRGSCTALSQRHIIFTRTPLAHTRAARTFCKTSMRDKREVREVPHRSKGQSEAGPPARAAYRREQNAMN